MTNLNNLTVNGRKPVNPFGSCFDSAAAVLLHLDPKYLNPVMCHGICIANVPGQEGEKMAHAWVEFTTDRERWALDPIWMIAQPVRLYRATLKVELVLPYPRDEFIRLWTAAGVPGPFDPRIERWTAEGKAAHEKG